MLQAWPLYQNQEILHTALGAMSGKRENLIQNAVRQEIVVHFSRERKMTKLPVIKTESWLYHDETQVLPAALIQRIKAFEQQIQSLFHLRIPKPIDHLRQTPGDLAVFYGETGEIAGYFYSMREKINLDHHQFTLCTAEMTLHPVYSFARPVARFFLTSAMKYKLNHPEEDFIHIAKAFDPTAYVFFNQMTTTLYPKPKQRVPDWAMRVIDYYNKKEELRSCPSHPLVVPTGELPPLQFKHIEADEELYQYYLSINPNYKAGDCLLTVVPLSLANIGFGIKRLLAERELTGQI